MIVLGIGGFFHDLNAAAVNVATGAIACAEEERFSRRKHHAVWSAQSSSIDAVHHVLRTVGATPDQVTHLVLSDLDEYPIKGFLRDLFPSARHAVVEHHTCHAAAAYLSSGFDAAAILSLDGFGDGHSGLLAVGQGGRVVPLRHIDFKDSIGLLYLQVTHRIGLGAFGAEGKTQGLAAYGEPILLPALMDRIALLDDGRFALDADVQAYEAYHGGDLHRNPAILSNPFVARHIPARTKDEPIRQEHSDAAASAQAVLDLVASHCAAQLHRETGLDHLVLTGGVAQNSTTNGRLLTDSGFREIYAHPASADRGNGLGAALHYVKHEIGCDLPCRMTSVYQGGAYDDAAIAAAADRAGHRTTRLTDASSTAAELLAAGHFVGWFQGRSEIGARALGNRSILAHPARAETRGRLNAEIKHREWFRPFAPSVLAEAAEAWFEVDRSMPTMMFTVPVRAARRDLVAAINHVDGSARLQTVRREDNPRYYALIDAFRARTGLPLVLNTSFNDAGEPIVETPEDAFRTFHSTGLDALIIGDHAVFRADMEPSVAAA